MDLLRIAVRCLITYIFLLVVMRLAGKRVVRHAESFDFVLALILGDLVDDALWSEVPVAQFVIATATLVFMKLSLTAHKLRMGAT
jgi:uncharacterized membrane protein YcaP (DUF421 family)